MTETERIDRQTLLKRAATVAGGAYLAPVLTSGAHASAAPCPAVKCKVGHPKYGDARCAKTGGGNTNCTCVADRDGFAKGTCMQTGCNGCSDMFAAGGKSCCDVLHPCGSCGEGGCFCNFDLNGCVCIQVFYGSCSSPQPCPTGECPAGQACFRSCCPEPLCRPICS